MTPFDKQQVSVGANPKHKFSCSAPMLSTNNFFEYRPLCCVELVPDSKGKFIVDSFVRTTPLYAPNLGQMKVATRSFLVRLPSLWPPFYSFKADTVHPNYGSGTPSIPSYVPTFDYVNLLYAIVQDYGQIVSGSGSYDLMVGTNKYRLNRIGRRLVSILASLGYGGLVAIGLDENGIVDNTMDVSALPLLAFARVYLDWYYPSQYALIDAEYCYVEQFYTAQVSYSFTTSDIYRILKFCNKVSYEANYLVSGWDNPTAPTNGLFSQVTLEDITVNGDSTFMHPYNSVVVGGTPSMPEGTPYYLMSQANPSAPVHYQVLSAYGIQMLNSMTAYMRSHQISGARALDRWLADFGCQIRNDKLNRSIYLGSSDFPIQVSDVMSHSDTDNAPIGAYAGKAIGGSNKAHVVDFDTKEDFCYLIAIQTITTLGMTYQGADRKVFRFDQHDFYNPRFDNKGVQAISSLEVYLSSDDPAFVQEFNASYVYGFVPTYADYKFLKASLSGDFIFGSVNAGLDTWHLFRKFKDSTFNNDPQNVVHGIFMVQADDSDQYRRIFNISNSDTGDPFRTLNWVSLEYTSPMLPLYDDYIFHEDVDHKKIFMDGNGAKLN